MEWDINTLRSLSTVFVAIAFAGVCWWAFSPKRRKRFNDAANLPFADDAAKNDLGNTESGDANPGESNSQDEKRQD